MFILTTGIFVLKYLIVQHFNVQICTKCLENV
jgi:hypothetical protein